MDERGLWELFYTTGLPEAYLALAGQRAGEERRTPPDGAAPALETGQSGGAML